MERHAGRSGTFLIAWSQTLVDGHADVPESALAVGAYWRWSGSAVDIGCAMAAPDSAGRREQSTHASEDARRVVGRALGICVPTARTEGDLSFTLSDGRGSWTCTLIDVPGQVRPLLLFPGAMPPSDTPLRIDWIEVGPRTGSAMAEADGAVGLVCFTPGTWIETPRGARQIEHLVAGDKVMTLDGGAQELVWTGMRRVTVRDLCRKPDITPVRIRDGALASARGEGDLVVSPDHRVLVRSRDAETGETSEVLVAARDLLDGEGVTREPLVRPATYVHLLLERHHILLANGVETESFHPGAASLDAIPETDRVRLFDVMPMLKVEPQVYGAWARPVLSRAEISLLSAA